MKTNSRLLLKELSAIANEDYTIVSRLSQYQNDTLSRKPSATGWSALECLEHLNLYAQYYLPKISESLENTQKGNNETFRSGLIGDYLVGMVKIKEHSKKMKTLKSMEPNSKKLNHNIITDFLSNQKQLQTLLQRAETSDINKGKIGVSFSKLLRLKSGDILRFMVYHNQRHVQQALRAIG